MEKNIFKMYMYIYVYMCKYIYIHIYICITKWLCCKTGINNNVNQLCVCTGNCVLLFATPWTVALQAPLSMEFSKQEYWSGLPCLPLPRNLQTQGSNLCLLPLLPWQADSLPLHPQWSPTIFILPYIRKINKGRKKKVTKKMILGRRASAHCS